MEDEVLNLFLEEAQEMVLVLEDDLLSLEYTPHSTDLIHNLFRCFHTIKGSAGMVGQAELSGYTHHVENLLSLVRDGKMLVTPELISLLLGAVDCVKDFLQAARGTETLDHTKINQSLIRVQNFSDSRVTASSSMVEEPPSSTAVSSSASPPLKAIAIDDDVDMILTEESQAPPSQNIATFQNNQTFLIHLRFRKDMLAEGGDPLIVLHDLEALGKTFVVPHPHAVPNLEQINPKELSLWWSVKLIAPCSRADVDGVLMFYLEEHDIVIEIGDSPPPETMQKAALNMEPTMPIMEPLPEMVPTPASTKEATASPSESNVSTSLPTPDVSAALHDSTHLRSAMASDELPPDGSIAAQPRISASSPHAPLTPASTAAPSTADPQNGAPAASKPKKVSPAPGVTQKSSSLRVDIGKLDTLQNLVGETVIAQSRFTQLYQQLEELDESLAESFLQLLDDQERTIRELQEQVMNVRMVPIGGAFAPLRRMVRDFAKSSGKQIQIQTFGEETEVDKTITEQLSGPLNHLVRNAMDHGIETPGERAAQGKPAQGTIHLAASHEEGYIVLQIQDDGAGIDPERILTKAQERGLVHEEEELSEQDILHLILKPGFSTAESVTSISGRGVGMDVVKREIEALRGAIEIQSTPGKGTTFRIKLPLTLAIIDGMVVKVGGNIFIIPLLYIVESLIPQATQHRTVQGQEEIIEVRGDCIPLVRLHRLFKTDESQTDPTQGAVVIVEVSGHKYCLMVDKILDQQQVVIKNLEENFVQVLGIVGATILGDGVVSLILDIPGVIQKRRSQKSIQELEQG